MGQRGYRGWVLGVRRWLRRYGSWAGDVALVLSVTAAQLLQLAVLVLYGTGSRPRSISAGAVLLVIGEALPLLLRRRYPLAVFAIVMSMTTVYYVAGYPPTDLDFPAMVALYSVAAACRLRTSLVAAASVVVAVGVVYAVNVVYAVKVAPRASWGDVVFIIYYLGLFAVAWAGGRYQQMLRRLREAQAAEAAARSRQAERDRQAQVEHVLAAERTRIARELHDTVAHHLSVMMLQTGGARRLVDAEPERARDALRVAEEAGKRALTAMPSLIRALRHGDEAADARHQPGLADLPTLISDVRAAGLAITLAVHGRPRALPPGVELSAYRVVQEALTNSLKHAGPTHATVDLTYQAGAVQVEINDAGSGTNRGDPSTGHGLLGMRERVAIFRGTFDAGPRPDGGFRVRAYFPADGA